MNECERGGAKRRRVSIVNENPKVAPPGLSSFRHPWLASIKVLSWEDVMSNERSGNVSEILMPCGASVCRIEENDLDKSKNKTLDLEIQQDEINAAVLERLQNFEDKLAQSRNKTSNLEEKLAEFQGRLQISEEELAESQNKTSQLEEKLTEVLGKL